MEKKKGGKKEKRIVTYNQKNLVRPQAFIHVKITGP